PAEVFLYPYRSFNEIFVDPVLSLPGSADTARVA
ncbi:MAG: hypothetical protein RL585_1157, partial [Pseudomonadota bacterium]